MRPLSTASLLFATLITVSFAPAGRADRLRNLEPGTPAPAFSLPTLQAGTLDSAALHGKAVVLLILAADQHNSEQAVLAAAEIAHRLASPDLALVAVTADTDHEAYFRQLWQDHHLDFPLGLDFQRQLYGELGVIVLPTTIVLDREGKLAHVLSSYRPDYPAALDAYARHALGLLSTQQLDRALAATSFEHNAPSDRAARHRAAANLLSDKKLYDEARVELEKAVAIDPANPDVRLDLANLALAQGQLAAARAQLLEVAAQHPENRRAKLLEGIVLFREQKFVEAEAALLEAVKLNPDPARAHYYLGRIYELRGDKDLALAHYREALQFVLGEPSPAPATQP